MSETADLNDSTESLFTVLFHSKRPHTITKINDNINMDWTIAGSVNAHS
jgi:hypothetical protein